MVECIPASCGWTARYLDGMCVIQPHQPVIPRAMQRERILDPVGALWSCGNAFDLEFDPITRLMDHVRVTIQGQKVFEGIIGLPTHTSYVIRT